jgi:acyl carrier protein
MTEANEFESAFRAVFEDVIGWGIDFGDGDSPRTIEAWDSLAQIRLVHGLESRFGVRLPDSALLEEQTMGSLRALVVERMSGP